MYTDKKNLLDLMKKESPQFLYLLNKSNLHLDWEDGLIFLYFLHSIIAYDNRRKLDDDYSDLLGLIVAMREVGIKLIPDNKSGIRIMYSKLWNDPDELNVWREFLSKHNQFLIEIFHELGELFYSAQKNE